MLMIAVSRAANATLFTCDRSPLLTHARSQVQHSQKHVRTDLPILLVKPLTLQKMGKGDKKTRKGKRARKSAGKSRPSKRANRVAAAKKATAKKAGKKAPKKAAKKAPKKAKKAAKKK